MKPREKTLTARSRARRARAWLRELYTEPLGGTCYYQPTGRRLRRLPMPRPWKVHHTGRLR